LNSCQNLNSLIVVRTGSGKTLVAALITKYWYNIRKKENALKAFKCVFLVPTRNLVHQQAASFRRAFSKDFIEEIDEKSNEFKIKEKFKLNEKYVFFMTPQKLVNALTSHLISISDISILIFDECHHANLQHPYNVIMTEFYLREKLVSKKLPLIVGLSASLGTGQNGSAVNHIFTLCSNMNCKIISYVKSDEDKKNLDENIPSPLEDILIHVKPRDDLKKLLDRTSAVVCEIMKLAKIDIQASMIGSKPFENFLYVLKFNSEKNNDQTRIIACKYLIELNLFYLGVQDFPIKYSLRKLENFLAKTNSSTFAPREIEFREKFQSLIDLISKNLDRFNVNAKLEKMTKLILSYHKSNSRGNHFMS
jgi:ERCC4-related helicase